MLAKWMIFGLRLVVAVVTLSASAHGLVTVDFTRQVAGGTFPSAGGTVDVTVTFTASGTGTVTNLAIEETIPAGWTYNSRLSAGTFFVEPTAGDAGPLAFAYNSIPTFPATLQYRLNVPSGQTGTKQITGTAAYNGGTPDDVQVGPKQTDISPQSAIAVLLSVSNLSVPEGNTATFGVKLSAQPASNTTVAVSRSSGDSDITVQSGASLTFTSANWNVNQTVTLAAAQDADTTNGSATIQGTSSGLTTAILTATEVDDDPVVIPIIFDKSTLNVPEGGTATFKVKLGSQPASNKTVNVSRTSGDTDISVQSGGSLTFTTANWNVDQTVTLAAAQDADATNGSAMIQGSGSGLTSASLTATEVDDDPLQVVFDRSTLDVPEGSTATFGVKLSAQPANNTQVTVSRTSGDTDITVQSGGSLTFTTANWNVNQTVTLAAAVDVDSVEGVATVEGAATGATAASLSASEVEECGDAPENDEFVNRIDLGSDTDVSTTGTNICASGEPEIATDFYATVWWKWRAPASLCDGAVVRINTHGSDFDTWLGVFSGTSLTSLTPVIANDDCGGITSCVQFEPQPNAYYAIVVDGLLPGQEGNIELSLQVVCPDVPDPDPTPWSGGAKFGGAIPETQIPSSQGKTFDGLTAAGESLAVRLSANAAIQPESIAAVADGITLDISALTWQEISPNDGWVLVPLDVLPHYGERVTIEVTAQTADGTNAAGYGEFKIPMPESITGKSDSVQVRAAEDVPSVPELLGAPASDVVRLWPPTVYAEPVTVRIPVDAGADPNQLAVRYYMDTDSGSGWVPGEDVIGWLSGEGGTVVDEDGQTYYEITVTHSGVLQITKVLARANEASVLPVELITPNGSYPWAQAIALVVLLVAVTVAHVLRTRRPNDVVGE